MGPRNRKIERNLLAALIAMFIFSLIIIITIIYQLKNFLLNNKSLLRVSEITQTNQDPNPLTPHEHPELPQPSKQEVVHYFNPRFQGIPDLHLLRRQVRENIDAIFEGAEMPWPEIMEAGFGYGALAAIDREVKLQGGGGENGNADETQEIGNEAHPLARDIDTSGWMLALFPKPEHENKNENENTSTLQKKGEEKTKEKSTCPIYTDELANKVAVAKPCRHRFCKGCLEDWMVHLGERGQEASCPVCGARIRRGVRGWVRGFVRRG